MSAWTASELGVLRKLRERFLARTGGLGDYWHGEESLRLYNETFAQRIGWKWDAVLREVTQRGWSPSSNQVIDFGCGTGIAGRKAVAHWPGRFSEVVLHDRSVPAMRFAAAHAAELRMEHESACGFESVTSSEKPAPDGALVLLSHIISELDDGSLGSLVRYLSGAAEIIWVESGTHEDSRRLISAVREPLLATGFRAIAPCTHQRGCGMLTTENARHWCHSFAAVRAEVFQDARWSEFSRELGIDLRALPYSFLVLQRESRHIEESGASRIIGRTRDYKGYSKLLNCDVDGVRELVLQKRDAPGLLKRLKHGEEVPLHRWLLRGQFIACEEGCEQKEREEGAD